jgi:hypothetical protein
MSRRLTLRAAGVVVAGVLAVLGGGAATAATASAAPGHLEGYIPVVANGPGKQGSYWTTDVWIYHQNASVLHLWFNRSGEDNAGDGSVVVELDTPVVQLTDIVGELFATEGIGSVHYLADGPVTVVSRTWTPAPEAGTYGQTIRGVPISAASLAGSGQGGALRVLLDDNPDSRSNLGVVNVSPVAVTAAVEVFSADGEPVTDAPLEVILEPFAMTQINDIFEGLSTGGQQGLIVRVGATSSEGAILSYVSQVDNTTNDASYQQAFRFAF